MADIATFSSFRRFTPAREPPMVVEPPPAPMAPPAEPPEVAALLEPVEVVPAQDAEAVLAVAPETDQPVEPASIPDPPRRDAWAFSSRSLGADQLGLAHPDVIVLQAKVRGEAPVMLEAHTAGIYRPPNFRPAPWSGFAYDQPAKPSTGLAAGTRILTARGEIEVEHLIPGDAAMALRGPALLPIAWIGRTPARAAPILIEPGALGPGIPRRLLCVGPDQAILIGPDPVAAHTLVNGTSIRAAEAAPSDLFHIDVGRADIILAEGVALSSSHGESKPG